MKSAWALLLALSAAGAWSQGACPDAGEVTQAQMLGLWRAELEGSGHAGTLLLEKHAEYSEGLSGWINRNGERSRLAGDVEDGELMLEESADGVHIAATWLGDVVDGSCGREIRGTWTLDGQQTGHPFVLRKQ